MGDFFCQSLRRPRLHHRFSNMGNQQFGGVVAIPALVGIIVREGRDNDWSIPGIDDGYVVTDLVQRSSFVCYERQTFGSVGGLDVVWHQIPVLLVAKHVEHRVA